MIASYQTLKRLQPVQPCVEKTIQRGMSYGLSQAGYDIRIDKLNIEMDMKHNFYILRPGQFALGSSKERFEMPNHFLGVVHDKSTWARKGLAVQNTVIEPGWCGYLTLELTNHSSDDLHIWPEDPIAQIIFHILDTPTDIPYRGKYQNQEAKPVEAIYE